MSKDLDSNGSYIYLTKEAGEPSILVPCDVLEELLDLSGDLPAIELRTSLRASIAAARKAQEGHRART